MDADLRNGLWNCWRKNYWDNFSSDDPMRPWDLLGSDLNDLFISYWHSFFKLPLDTLSRDFRTAYSSIREHFFKFTWSEVYDFIEFSASNGPKFYEQAFRADCNLVLERENSAFRFVSTQITPITSDIEVKSIEAAMSKANPFAAVKTHLETSLALLSDRKSPDFRNSIKESISAVEALAQRVSGNHKATLGDALKVLEGKKCLHGALKNSLSNLYGYTSDAQGIRHALLDEPTLTYGEAKFMLVSCTAFINFILAKVAELNISIK